MIAAADDADDDADDAADDSAAVAVDVDVVAVREEPSPERPTTLNSLLPAFHYSTHSSLPPDKQASTVPLRSPEFRPAYQCRSVGMEYRVAARDEPSLLVVASPAGSPVAGGTRFSPSHPSFPFLEGWVQVPPRRASVAPRMGSPAIQVVRG